MWSFWNAVENEDSLNSEPGSIAAINRGPRVRPFTFVPMPRTWTNCKRRCQGRTPGPTIPNCRFVSESVTLDQVMQKQQSSDMKPSLMHQTVFPTLRPATGADVSLTPFSYIRARSFCRQVPHTGEPRIEHSEMEGVYSSPRVNGPASRVRQG